MKKMSYLKKIFAVNMVIVILASFAVSLSAAGNGWKWPVTNVCAGASPVWVTDGFNCSCDVHGGSHSGIDINAKSGSNVIAAKGGTVYKVFTGCKGSHLNDPNCKCETYGNHVIISHGNNLYTLYAHLSSVSVSTGMSVEQGQAIGIVGKTGYATGPHLHFEVRSGSPYYSAVKNPRLSDYIGGAHLHNFSKGKCTSCGALLGDVNNDGALNAKDSLCMNQFIAGNTIAIDMALADINRDGKVDSTDLSILKQIFVGSYNW